MGILLGLSGCESTMSEVDPLQGTAPSASDTWKPPSREISQKTGVERPTDFPVEFQATRPSLQLSQMVDMALRQSPATRKTWSAARTAAAERAVARGAYYPIVDVGAAMEVVRSPRSVTETTTYEGYQFGPGITLNYLLLDFGGRSATVEAAKQALEAANWWHNQSIQDVILLVSSAYYRHQAALAQVKAGEAGLEAARADLAAANERLGTGLGIESDVLQTKTRVAEMQALLESQRAMVLMTRGELATAMGLPANTSVETAVLPMEIPAAKVAGDVDRLIELAQKQRPGLASQRASVLAKLAEVRKAESRNAPAFSINAGASQNNFSSTAKSGSNNGAATTGNDYGYGAGLGVTFPLFEGFMRQNEIVKVQTQVETARADLAQREQQVMQQVWNSYYSLQTATRQLEASVDFVTSASKSHDVAKGRYEGGMGSLLEVLHAQSDMARAQAQNVQARALMLLSFAQLAHDTGEMDVGNGELK